MSARTAFRRGAEAIREAAGAEYAPPPPEGEGALGCALHYGLQVGWRVFPVGADKRPLVRDWPNAATADEARIREWWSRWPEAGIGVATGRASGVYVVDIDPGHDGLASWERLEARHGDVISMVSRTGGGGWHLFFRAPATELRNTAGRLGAGIDTRGEGGYVVLPPSPHPSGERYAWSQWRRPQHLPAWIAEAVQDHAAGAQRAARPEVGVISEGVRNTTLTSYAGALRHVGADEEAIAAALDAINEAAGDPPLPGREVRAIARSVARYTPGRVAAERLEEAEGDRAREWVEYNGLQLGELEDPLVEWVVPRLAARGIVTLLAGEWKTAGKTTLLISAVNAVLHGGEFLGQPASPGKVLYLYEGPATEFRQNDFAHQLEHENFTLVPQDENAGRTWAETIEYAERRCLELPASWLVIDTKTAWMSGDGEEENQAGFARAAMNSFAQLKLANVAITVAAHPTKAAASLAKMVAGSGQWAAAAGRQVGLWAHQDVTDTRRELESVGRQGYSNNYPREVIEWDRHANTYAILGPASEVRADQESREREDRLEQDTDRLIDALGEGPWDKADAYTTAKDRFDWGEKRTDQLITLALGRDQLTRTVGAHGKHVYEVRT